jgi:hypothetical protein
MWAVSVVSDVIDAEVMSDVIGVAIVGAGARVWNGRVLNVQRVAVLEGWPNACSMLYGACARAARAMGAEDLVTYTHGDEPGTTLRAAGWVDGGLTRGGEYNRPSRRRPPQVDAGPKRRWFAPWGIRAKAAQ